MGTPLVRRSTVSSWLSHLYGSVLPSLCSASAKYLVSFSTNLTHPGTLPRLHMHPSAKTDLEVNASEDQDAYGLALSPDFSPHKELSVHA